MPTFMVELALADRMQLQELGFRATSTSDVDEKIRWLLSFLSADQLKTYCLFEAPSADMLWAAARNADLPTSAIVEVDRIDPTAMSRAEASGSLRT